MRNSEYAVHVVIEYPAGIVFHVCDVAVAFQATR